MGNVIESIKMPGPDIKVYGPLLRMIHDELGYHRGTFQAFPYDWRQSNVRSAAELARFMGQKVAEGVERFYILAHSMGGIVTRLALQSPGNSALLNRVSGYVQIATPVRGSSLAYASLRRGPSFHPLFDRVRNVIARLAPLTLHDLLDSLSGCDSMFQLLPPPDDKILQRQSGLASSAFDADVWPPQYSQSLGRAKAVHAPIQAPPQCQYRTILSDGVDTDYRYLVDTDFDIVRALPQARGDGTVCEHSARAGSDSPGLVTVSSHVPHDQLPNRASVFDMIVKGGWLG